MNNTDLTEREQQICLLIAYKDMTVRQELANELFLSKRTIDNHLSNIMAKLDTKNMGSLVRKIMILFYPNEFKDGE